MVPHNLPNAEVIMVNALQVREGRGTEVLEFPRGVPAPGPTEVRIKVKAIGINSRPRSMWRHDMYIRGGRQFPGRVLGYEAGRPVTRSAGTSAAVRGR